MQRKAREGFTLIELVITIGLMVVLFSMAISAPLNHFETESKVIERQIETSIQKGVVWAEANIEVVIIEFTEKEILVKTSEGFEIDRLKTLKGHNIKVTNSGDIKEIKITQEGRIYLEDESKPINIEIQSERESKLYIYELHADGVLREGL